MTPLLPPVSVREIAQQNGYHEVDEHNSEKSHLLSFRNNTTRINVYYTTGTVGTCLNHPRRGKSQLFRRDVDVDTLCSIFTDPRVHTGEGYYHRRSITQKWKQAGTDDKNKCMSDSARRWQFVGHSTGLVHNDQEMQIVIDIVTEWDNLYWEPNTIPHLHRTRFACGSRGALLQMLYEVVRETVGDFWCYSEATGWRSDENLPFVHRCENETAFSDVHAADVRRLKPKFIFLREDIRVELMQWFLGRDCCGARFYNSDRKILATEYSDAVSDTLIDYGRLMYAKKSQLCHHCGVVKTNEGTRQPVTAEFIGGEFFNTAKWEEDNQNRILPSTVLGH